MVGLEMMMGLVFGGLFESQSVTDAVSMQGKRKRKSKRKLKRISNRCRGC